MLLLKRDCDAVATTGREVCSIAVQSVTTCPQRYSFTYQRAPQNQTRMNFVD